MKRYLVILSLVLLAAAIAHTHWLDGHRFTRWQPETKSIVFLFVCAYALGLIAYLWPSTGNIILLGCGSALLLIWAWNRYDSFAGGLNPLGTHALETTMAIKVLINALLYIAAGVLINLTAFVHMAQKTRQRRAAQPATP